MLKSKTISTACCLCVCPHLCCWWDAKIEEKVTISSACCLCVCPNLCCWPDAEIQDKLSSLPAIFMSALMYADGMLKSKKKHFQCLLSLRFPPPTLLAGCRNQRQNYLHCLLSLHLPQPMLTGCWNQRQSLCLPQPMPTGCWNGRHNYLHCLPSLLPPQPMPTECWNRRHNYLRCLPSLHLHPPAGTWACPRSRWCRSPEVWGRGRTAWPTWRAACRSAGFGTGPPGRPTSPPAPWWPSARSAATTGWCSAAWEAERGIRHNNSEK